MRVIKPTTIQEYGARHRDAQAWLKGWLTVVSAAEWQGLKDVQKTYKKADAVKVKSGNIVTVFDVKGNKYRLVVAIHYNTQRVYVRDFMTHEQYNNQLWKNRH